MTTFDEKFKEMYGFDTSILKDEHKYYCLSEQEATMVCTFRGQKMTLYNIVQIADHGDVISGLPIDVLLYTKITCCVDKARKKRGQNGTTFYQHLKNHDVRLFVGENRHS